MKFTAIILSLCLLIYFADIPLAVLMCLETEKTESCSKKSCEQPAKEKPCSSQESDCTDICFNCPLAYVATLAVPFQLTHSWYDYNTIFNEYNLIYEHQFYTTAWKPPNRTFPYSVNQII